MAKLRKVIEAIGEIFKSEQNYIQDLLMWERDFRIWILNCPLFSTPKIKYEICDRIFINLENIQKLHENIYKDMKKMNLSIYSEITGNHELKNTEEYMIDKVDINNPKIQKLEYVSIYEKYIEEFELYKEYVRRLPKADFELEKLIFRLPEFEKGVENFLKEKNAEFLGVKHFLYRPSQKLARYPMLLRAVAKNTEGELKSAYENLIEKFMKIAKNADKEFNRFGTQFAIYRLGINFSYKKEVRNQHCLALFQKKRRLLKEGKVLVRGETKEDSPTCKLFIFDHLILICDYPKNKFAEIFIREEPIFMARLVVLKKDTGFFPQDESFEELSPLLLFEIGGDKAQGLYFQDKGERDVYYNIIQKAILQARSKLRSDVTIEELPFNIDEPVKYVCKATDFDWYGESLSSSGSLEEESFSTPSEEEKSFSEDSEEKEVEVEDNELIEIVNRFLEIKKKNSEEEKRQSEETDQIGSQTKPKKGQSLWKILFPTADFFVSSIQLPPPLNRRDDAEYIFAQKNMYIIATSDGVCRFFNNRIDKILERKVKKIIYDSTYEIMLYQSESILYASHFNVESTSLEENVLKDDIEDFFYGITKQGPCIASTDSGDGKSFSIFLFLAIVSNRSIVIELSRRLYVGLQVYNVFFCSDKIVIASKDFEIIDMETLRTEELLQIYDPFIPVLFQGLQGITARSIFPVSPHEFLLCFDSIGFIVDEIGKLKRTDVIFLWNCVPIEFKVIRNYVICIGANVINIFCLKTGLLVFSKFQDGLRFVTGSLEPLVHDGRKFYKIIFGEDSEEEDIPDSQSKDQDRKEGSKEQ
ncbi:Rho/Rac/Cdc42-like GTPases guanine nucleotide exchange factor [Encephalitozoon intestinalis ATCC 50506]|uniref:Rho/Rac/Cdc42-like GTPases guanine nucleotide exchange factor n=1 Tax=Encephalitozoon intestinalis (strain ATCC 50506) TaxID=876142 RepID=E0S655_ENCIT|nr:Rho/Rac/Cdc42-like GTPases guanine nucleotide exchange factor [Encephalitozoon intestinalis ATCC 50506]ADM11190.1 Rho/Rac/Cdc42-like GTPases guanine nucleotide exchange factor [Encephalitozoon intestinalis ATCC 50506]UTX44857.1 RhoGEF domain-containing protein [Encephalitozoon intestinalis]